jgi:large subunit ribosomal protein L19e
MKLRKKKELASRALKIGKERITFLQPRLDEIKEAITKQEIKDLQKKGAIIVKEKKGRKKIRKKAKQKSPGNIRKNVNTRKREYIIATRKLRNYVKEMVKEGKITKEDSADIRKRIRNKGFRSKAHLKEYIENLHK